MSTASSSSARVPVEERLFSLVLALLATEAGLTKSEILSTVQGYRQRYSVSGDNASLERQFERDKDDIRDLGVPLETVEIAGEAQNNHNLRYRIPKGGYDLPADIHFSAQEITLLSLAGAVWREGSLAAESRRAIMKLRSLGVESDEPIVGYAPRLRARESSFDPLSLALDHKNIVTFDYLKPGEAAARRRRVAPLALVQHRGRWHLKGTDQDADDDRTFLLSRIVGTVKATTHTFTANGTDYASHTLDELEAIWQANIAEVEVIKDSDAASRLSKRFDSVTGTSTLRINYADINVLADELAGYGPEVLVLSPPQLREKVVARLHATIGTHQNDNEEDRDD